MTIILGIDPGSRVTGYGLISVGKRVGRADNHSNGQPQYLASGCIRMPTGDMSERLLTIYQSIGQLINEYTPDQAAIEQVFVGKSASSALKLGHARGAAMLAVSAASIPLSEYAPRSIKQAVTGTGSADKIQVQEMVVTLLKLNQAPAVDAADALAVAICHTYSDNPYARAL